MLSWFFGSRQCGLMILSVLLSNNSDWFLWPSLRFLGCHLSQLLLHINFFERKIGNLKSFQLWRRHWSLLQFLLPN